MTLLDFSNFGSLKSTETVDQNRLLIQAALDFSNFGSLKSTETIRRSILDEIEYDFSNFGSLKSTETERLHGERARV